ncbi:phage tail tape measure protein [Ornithinibacillus sp. L9]|uniref:Phage tail tape measure protein n=1 Tax=Ornithinibacillus caprae TaxID=2678566 RepID=A0A6N8FNZ6_9BACI|nr:phage tail tape measure protein [Ornithinibacillus caprae]MUK89158.1 phage tail tape measure protein [Ornithinibacillus caprae]
MATIRELQASFVAKANGMKSAIKGIKNDFEGLDDKAKKTAQNVTKKFNETSKKMKSIGGSMTKNVSVPIMAIGTAAFVAADSMDKAFNNIRVGTGATGKDLEGLKEDFREVFTDIPVDADTASNAIAGLNTMTGATGKVLQGLTKNVLEASRMLGEDGVSNANAFGNALVQWQIPAEKGEEYLDKLFKATQDYGVSLNALTGHLTKFGPVLQNAGFTMDEAADLFGKLEKGGIQVTRVMPGLNKAFRNWADEGKDAKKELQNIIDEMQNAESETEALSIVSEVFGAEGAQRITTAIRSGVMPSLEELGKGLEDSQGLIEGTGEETQSFGDKMLLLKNKAQDGLQPVGDILLKLADEWLPKVISAVEKVTGWFANLSPTGQKVVLIIGAIAAGIGPLLMVLGSLIGMFSGLAGAAAALNIGLLPLTGIVFGIVAAIAALIAIGIAVWKNWDTIREKAIEIWGFLIEFFSNFFSNLEDLFNKALNWIDEVTNGKFKSVTDTIRKYMEMGKENIQAVLKFIRNTFKNALDFLKSLVKGDFKGMKDAIGNQLENTKQLISKILGNISKFFSNTIGKIVTGVQNKFSEMRTKVSTIFGEVKSAITNPIETARDKVKETVDKITGFFSNIGDKMKIKIPKPKLPKFSIEGEFSLAPPKVPKIGISWNAEGGIFNKPTIFDTNNAGLQGVGEAGAEAIIPLKDSVLGKIGKMILKATGWSAEVKDNGIAEKLDWVTSGRWAESVINIVPINELMLSKFADQLNTGDEELSKEEVIPLLERIAEAVEKGQDLSVVLNDRIVGKSLESIISEEQKRKNAIREAFKG